MTKPRLLVYSFIFCALVSRRLMAAERFFPLSAGNFWQYRSADGEHQFRIETSIPLLDGGFAYHSVRGYLAPNERLHLREDPGKGLMALDSETSTERLISSFSAQLQPTFPADGRPCGTVMGSVQVPRESSILPSGYWEDMLRITYQTANCGAETIESELYAPGIGMVQRTYRVGSGTRQFNLVMARVSNQLIFTRDFTVASLSVFPPTQGATSLKMNLTMVGGFGNEPPLSFPTTQRYDVVIRDADGNKIWQYSDGKTFIPEPVTIRSNPSYDIEVPLDNLPRKSIAPGIYIFEAWLTTAGPNPPNGTSVLVTINDFGQPPIAASAINRSVMRGVGTKPLPGRPMRY